MICAARALVSSAGQVQYVMIQATLSSSPILASTSFKGIESEPGM
jgi:hypothetical protein